MLTIVLEAFRAGTSSTAGPIGVVGVGELTLLVTVVVAGVTTGTDVDTMVVVDVASLVVHV